METFTKVAQSYGISVKELKDAYNRAVKRASREVLKKLSYQVLEDELGDEDVALIGGDLSGYFRLRFGSFIREIARRRALPLLEESLRECTSLRVSPMLRAFLKSSECRELLKDFPKDVERLVFLKAERTQEILLKDYNYCEGRDLRTAEKELRKIGFGG